MTTFAERFDAYYCALADYSAYRGYYEDNGVQRWAPVDPVEIEPEKRFGPGAMAVGELDDFDCDYDCEEFYSNNDEPTLIYEEFEPEEF